MERIDLHTHTLASDGSDTPAAVVQQAAALGLRLHDEDHVEAHDHRGAHEEQDRVAGVLILHRGQRSWPEGSAAVTVGLSTWEATRGVASLVRADFTSSSRRSQSRSAVPMRAMNT